MGTDNQEGQIKKHKKPPEIWIWAQVKKKLLIIVVILAKVRTLSLLYPKIHSELSSRTHGVTVIEEDNHLKVAGSILTIGE